MTEFRRSANVFVAALPDDVGAALRRAADLRVYAEGTCLVRRGEPIREVYFPLSGTIAHLEEHRDGKATQIAMVGREGVSGFEVLLGVPTAQFSAVTPVPLAALVARPATLLRLDRGSVALHALLERYAVASMRLVAIGAACARHDRVEARLARWLWELHERRDGEELLVTHERSAAMLGAQRAGVTRAYAALARRGGIRQTRGRVHVVDSRRLRAAACDCTDESRRLFEELYASFPVFATEQARVT